MATTIEWVQGPDGQRGMTWGVLRGCSRISPGCGGGGAFAGPAVPGRAAHGGCYAEGIAARFAGPNMPFEGFAEMTPAGPRWTRRVALVRKKLDEPLRRRKPTTWFISMSDLFHEALVNEEIAAIFGVMAACPQHTFQVLTKRAERLPAWFRWADAHPHPDGSGTVGGPFSALWDALSTHAGPLHGLDQEGDEGEALARALDRDWPLPNVWLGVTVEARAYKPRIEHLRETPAAVRFISFEPLLEDLGELDLSGIDQVIVGAESGRGARAMDEDWVRRIRDQAKAQGAAFFLKQKLDTKGHKVSLPMLDGRQWAEMPGGSR
jgi:protein gp37